MKVKKKKVAKGPIRLTAVICTYNRYDVLNDAILSLEAQQFPIDAFEIIVVDNSPGKERSLLEKSQYSPIPNLIWVHEERAGLSNARNVAMRMARGAVIAFIDDDAIADANWCRAIWDSFKQFDDDVAVVGGKVVPKFKGTRPEWLSDRLLAHLSMVDLGPKRKIISADEWVVGANVAYRTHVLRDIGGFSTSLGRVGTAGLLSSEETDVANKLRAAGFKTGYAPDALVQHLVDETRTSQAWFAKRFAWQAVSAILANETGGNDVAAASDTVRNFFATRHPSERHVGALLVDLSDADQLQWQLGTIYDLLVVLLSKGRWSDPVAQGGGR